MHDFVSFQTFYDVQILILLSVMTVFAFLIDLYNIYGGVYTKEHLLGGQFA